MFAKKTLIAAAFAVTAFTAAPAFAGGVTFGFGFDGPGFSISTDDDEGMSPGEIRHMLHQRGYHDINFVDDDGPIYKLTATKHGDDYFIVVNDDGDILNRHEI
jgi:hypothetical protein